jgi:hypothetical protein
MGGAGDDRIVMRPVWLTRPHEKCGGGFRESLAELGVATRISGRFFFRATHFNGRNAADREVTSSPRRPTAVEGAVKISIRSRNKANPVP